MYKVSYATVCADIIKEYRFNIIDNGLTDYLPKVNVGYVFLTLYKDYPKIRGYGIVKN